MNLYSSIISFQIPYYLYSIACVIVCRVIVNTGYLISKVNELLKLQINYQAKKRKPIVTYCRVQLRIKLFIIIIIIIIIIINIITDGNICSSNTHKFRNIQNTKIAKVQKIAFRCLMIWPFFGSGKMTNLYEGLQHLSIKNVKCWQKTQNAEICK